MALMVSSPFSVRAGSAIGGEFKTDRPLPAVQNRLSDSERRRLALRMRRSGWSYQRIAEKLQMRYSLVAAIAESDASPLSSEPMPITFPAAAVQGPPSIPDAEGKLDGLIAAVTEQGKALARLEASVPQAIQAANDSLFDRLTLAFQALLERLISRGAGDSENSGDKERIEPTMPIEPR